MRNVFHRRYGSEPTTIVRAPGRVNLIGEHTDYNEGFVLPLAIDRDVLVAARSRSSDDTVAAYAVNYDRNASFKIAEPARDVNDSWSNYLRGVAFMLCERGLPLMGMDLVVAGSVPAGAGLSSSAALELATAWAFQALGKFALDAAELALLCQRAENDFVGVRCGIMDQLVVALGRRGHALFLDCRDLSYRHVLVPKGVKVVVTDSLLRRELANSAYNERRTECAEGTQMLRRWLPRIRSLRDVTPAQLAEHESELPDVLRRRCRHVVSENARVQEAAEALERGDAARVGELMEKAHISLRDDFEVSLPELDVLVAAAKEAGALGARLTGAGFGGCIVSLVADGEVESFGQRVAEIYRQRTARESQSYICEASDGAGVVV